jgi:hypothetical protein
VGSERVSKVTEPKFDELFKKARALFIIQKTKLEMRCETIHSQVSGFRSSQSLTLSSVFSRWDSR